MKPLHILKIMNIQGFETHYNEKVSSVGWYYTATWRNLVRTNLSHWAIVSGNDEIVYIRGQGQGLGSSYPDRGWVCRG